MDTPSPYQASERFPVTAASRHTVFRSYPSQPELQNGHRQMERGWSHIRPDSVLVAAMGNHWRGPSWNKVIDMVDYTQAQGVYCAMSEIQDRCFNPYDALGTMRNEAILTALGEGFQYLCYIDNDVQPEPDFLIKMLSWGMPVTAPYVVEPGTGKGLFGPALTPATGLQRAKWTVLSMLMFQTAVFRQIGPEFWRDAIGADEGYHFQKLAYYGYQLFIDTGLPLVVGGRPLFPLAINRMTSGSIRDVETESRSVAAKIAGIFGRRNIILLEADQKELADALTGLLRVAKGDREIALQQRIERFVEAPDRRAIDPNSPWVKDGEYAPFLVKSEQEQAKAKGQLPGTGTSNQDIVKALAYSGVGLA